MNVDISRSSSIFAILAGITGVAGSLAVAGYSRQFVVAPIDALVVRTTPGWIITWMIENVGEEAHALHIALSVAIAVGLLTGTALLGLLVMRRLDLPSVGVGIAGVLAWGLTAAITGEPSLAVGAAVPVALFTAVASFPGASPAFDPSRRRTLTSGGGALVFVGFSIGRELLKSDGSTNTSTSPVQSPDSDLAGVDDPDGGENEDQTDDEQQGPVRQRFQEAADASLDLAGDDLPGLITPIEDFYNVDIAEFDPEVPSDDWSLTLNGEVQENVTIDFDELTDMPIEHRFVTLRCVGERLNGRKLDTAVWTGTPIKPLLERADPNGECNCVMLRAEDDYFVQFPVEALEDGFLAWGMNGQPLPQAHGHPVRVLVPGHWGETNVKWLSEIELLNEEMDGYWERRGWEGTGPVNTVAKLWDDTRLDDGRIEVAGHAYAGTRGIERVEVSIDGGETWQDARLSDPLDGDDVWRQWQHVFQPDGTHEVVVRAIDGNGDLQTEEHSDPSPSGSTGWVSKQISR